MIIRDDIGLNEMGDLGFSLRKTLKKLAPHNILKKISPVQALLRRPKKRGGPAAAPEAAPAAAAAPAGGSPTPIPGGYQVDGNDPAGNYFTTYFPDLASANAYNAQLQAQGGYGTVAPTSAAPGGPATAPYMPGSDPGAAYGPAPAGGGSAASYGGGPAYGPAPSDGSPYADDAPADEEGPAADEEEAPRRPSRLPKAPAVSPVPTIAPAAASTEVPTWAWVAGGVLVAGATYMVLKKKGIL